MSPELIGIRFFSIVQQTVVLVKKEHDFFAE